MFRGLDSPSALMKMFSQPLRRAAKVSSMSFPKHVSPNSLYTWRDFLVYYDYEKIIVRNFQACARPRIARLPLQHSPRDSSLRTLPSQYLGIIL